MKSILYIDDDAAYRAGIQRQLKRFGYEVETLGCTDEAYQRALGTAYSIFLVDLVVGDQDGTTFVCQLRAAGITAPIAMFSAHDNERFVTSALRHGADHYFLKTMSIALLAAHIFAILAREERKEGRKPTSQRRIAIGRFVLDRKAHNLECDGEIVKLTEKETRLIDLLAENPKHTYPVRELMEKIWGNDYSKSEKALHAMIKRLRHKLDRQYNAKDLIENNHGRGFRLGETALLPADQQALAV